MEKAHSRTAAIGLVCRLLYWYCCCWIECLHMSFLKLCLVQVGTNWILLRNEVKRELDHWRRLSSTDAFCIVADSLIRVGSYLLYCFCFCICFTIWLLFVLLLRPGKSLGHCTFGWCHDALLMMERQGVFYTLVGADAGTPHLSEVEPIVCFAIDGKSSF